MKKRIQLIMAALLISSLVVGPAFCENTACSADKGGTEHHGKRAEIMNKLNLTAEQQKLLKDTKEAHRAEMAKLFLTMKEKRKALTEAMAKPGVTRQQVEGLVTEMKALQAEIIDHRIDGIFKIKEILSPEQFQKLQSMREERPNKGRWRHQSKEER